MSEELPYQSEDAVLAEKIKEGIPQAFEKLFERYHRQLFYMAKKYVKDHELAEDAVQDVFVKLWEKRSTLDTSRSVKSFLFTMLKNHLLNMIRDRKKKILSVYHISEEELPREDKSDDNLIYSEYHQIVMQGLDELSDKKREVFEMRAFKGLSNEQVASMLSTSVNTVKTQYYHSSKFIRAYLEKHASINS